MVENKIVKSLFKSKRLLLCLVVFQVIVPLLLHAQNTKEDFTKVSLAYANSKEVSLDITVMSYMNDKDTKGNLVTTGTYLQSGDNVYSRFQSTEMIQASGKILIVNNQYKTIQIHDYKKSTAKEETQIPSVDSTMNLYDSVKYMGLQANSKHYIIYQQSSQYPVMHIYIDKGTYLITRMIMYLPQSDKDVDYGVQRLDVKYSKAKTKGINYFDLSRYVINTKQGYVLAKAYENYTLLD